MIRENLVVPNSSEIHAAADQELEKTALPAIIRGYSGLIPTKFRNISNGEKSRLKREDESKIRATALEKELIEPKDFTKYVRIMVAKEKWQELAEVSNVLSRFPQFVPYFLDCARKHAKALYDNQSVILHNIEGILRNTNILEYLRIYIVRFLTNENYLNAQLVMECYVNLKRSEGVYLGRSILESVEKLVDRDDVLKIKNDFTRADRAEKRQILKIMRLHLSPSEFTSFYKNISLNEDDIWYQFIQKTVKI